MIISTTCPELEMLLVFLALLSSSGADEYADLMRSDVTARVLPLNITINSTEPVDAHCSLTLHRASCKNPPLTVNDTISWHTRICFNWKCNAPFHAMRVENCWVGTRKSPVYLVKPDGCTAESALLHSPSYVSFLRAASVGWLSIRQAGVDELLVSCHITLCHVCDDNCREYTPPRSCRDSSVRNYDQMWNESVAVERACSPPPVETTTVLLMDNAAYDVITNSILISLCFVSFVYFSNC
ncbi:hypothetical protein Y032_0012g1773 [Ancylostoma ceylanicum]|uniref:ZP domain-containing protein n=1 Tax=Ancylostoma ceylanicum TaxID=53326 RepID=A0A016VEQ7_9BILA|nr:hypothetical protein Y032_0012g1773 [Ancylostoma ceylanicum]